MWASVSLVSSLCLGVSVVVYPGNSRVPSIYVVSMVSVDVCVPGCPSVLLPVVSMWAALSMCLSMCWLGG
jgi:hypothetical protein